MAMGRVSRRGVTVAWMIGGSSKPVAPVTSVDPAGVSGFTDGTGGLGGSATMNHPSGIALDVAGNLVVMDSQNNAVRKIFFLQGHP